MASEYRQLLLSMGPTVWVDGVDGTHLQETGNSPVVKHANGSSYALNSGTGPIVGGAASVVAGERSYCCLIGGLKSAAVVPGLTDLLTNGFSTVAIVKPRQWGSAWDSFVRFGQAFINGEIIFSRYASSNNLHIGWWNGTTSGPFLVTTNNALVVGKEQLVVATWNPADGKARLYMDGVKVAESAIAGPATNANRNIFAMGQNCGTTELFDGYITLPAVFLRPLTDAEIAALAAKSTVKAQHLSGNLPLSPRMTGGIGQVIGRTQFSGDIAFRATPDAAGAWSTDIASIGVDLDFTGIIGKGPGQLAGIVPNITSILGVPTSAEIRVLYRPDGGGVADGEVIASVTSGVDGAWSVDNLDPSLMVDVICRKDGYNDLVWSQASPAEYPYSLGLVGSFATSTNTFGLTGSATIEPGGGGLAPYTLQVLGSPPPGITFTLSGLTITASGICVIPGNYSWTLKITDSHFKTATLACSATGIASANPYWRYAKFALHMDGANGATSIVDDCGNTWTRTGTVAALSTAQKKYGTASLRETGIDSDFSVPAGSLGLGPNTKFTLSGYAWIDDTAGTNSGRHVIFAQGGSTSDAGQVFNFVNGKLQMYRGASPGPSLTVSGITTAAINTFHHVELGFDGAFFYMFLNGNLEAKVADTLGWNTFSQPYRVGRLLVVNYESFRAGISGYLDDLVLLVGECQHTAAFTPPTGPFVSPLS